MCDMSVNLVLGASVETLLCWYIVDSILRLTVNLAQPIDLIEPIET